MRDYTLTINVTVTDPKALYEAATVRWHEDEPGGKKYRGSCTITRAIGVQ